MKPPEIGDIATQLKCAREAAGLGQREAAILAGISNVHLNNIEHRRGSPTIRLLLKLSDVYDWDFTISALKE